MWRLGLDTIDDTDLVISVISVREISKGIEKKRKTDEAVANTIAKAADAIFVAYEGRILPIDEAVARRWGQMLGQSDKNTRRYRIGRDGAGERTCRRDPQRR